MFNRPFSDATLRQASGATLEQALAEDRKTVQGVTVDGATSKDFDDAIWVEPAQNGGYTVSVSIADVSALVAKDSAMDRDAMQRASSLYRPHGVSPMLPGVLSDNLLSLCEGEMRPTLTATIELDRKLNVTKVTLEKTKLVSQKRYTYEAATRKIADRDDPMHEWGKLAHGLMEKRRKQGALAFYDAKSGIYVSGDNGVQQLKAQAAPAHILVQELMILANSVVAKTMADAGMPYPFRNHRAASLSENGEDVVHKLDDFVRHGELDIQAVNRLAHLYRRATYDSTSQGHVGLRLPHYTHFTSPIRRYPDLIGHRIIKAFIDGQPSPYTQTDLDIMLPDITERINAENGNKSEVLKQHRLDRATRQSLHASAERVLALAKGDFSTLVRAAAESGEIGEKAANAIAGRIRDKRCSLPSMVQIMTYAPMDNGLWDWLRQQILAHIKQYPHDAVSLLEASSQLHKDKWTYGLHSRLIGTPDKAVYTAYVVATIDGEAFSNTITVQNIGRKATEQQAAIAFWEQYAAGTLVSPQEMQMPEARPSRPKARPVEKNPLIAWNNIATMHGYRQEWAYDSLGTEHVPHWRAILTLTGEKIATLLPPVHGEGISQKAARLDAIKQVMDDDRLPHNASIESDVSGNGHSTKIRSSSLMNWRENAGGR